MGPWHRGAGHSAVLVIYRFSLGSPSCKVPMVIMGYILERAGWTHKTERPSCQSRRATADVSEAAKAPCVRPFAPLGTTAAHLLLETSSASEALSRAASFVSRALPAQCLEVVFH